MQRMVPDEVILGLLMVQPTHGYVLLERFRSKAHLGRIWNMSTSQIYAVLKRLEEGRLVEGSFVEGHDAPSRKEYTITQLGKTQLFQWMDDPNPPTSIHRIRVMFLSRLYIAKLLDYPINQMLNTQIDVCERQKADLETKQAESKTEIEMLAIKYIIGQLNAALEWLSAVKSHSLSGYQNND